MIWRNAGRIQRLRQARRSLSVSIADVPRGICRGRRRVVLRVAAPIATVDQHRLSGYQNGVHAMRKIVQKAMFPKAMARAVWLATTLALSGLLWGLVPGQAWAGFCSATKCSLTLTNGKFTSPGTGIFGTVTLGVVLHIVTIDVKLADAYRMAGDHQKEIAQLHAAVAAAPDDFDLHMMVGRALRDQRQLGAAAQHFVQSTSATGPGQLKQ